MILRHSFEPVDNTRLAHLCGSSLQAGGSGIDVIAARNETAWYHYVLMFIAAVNLRCLEGLDLVAIPVHHYDGRAL